MVFHSHGCNQIDGAQKNGLNSAHRHRRRISGAETANKFVIFLALIPYPVFKQLSHLMICF